MGARRSNILISDKSDRFYCNEVIIKSIRKMVLIVSPFYHPMIYPVKWLSGGPR